MEDSQTRHIRARAALTNTSGRFEEYSCEAFDDGWGEERVAELAIRTEVRDEAAKSVISYNRSPDLPFDRSINPYRGCEHGCIYCFARPTHAYLGLSPGLDFETKLIARPNAAAVLRKELASKSYQPAVIALGTNTDPYQPIEKDRRIARACLKVLAETHHPVALVTKGTLIERDIDILSDMASRGLARVGISVTTLDASLCRKMEPRAPSPTRRLQVIEKLAKAGIDVRIMASPMVPAMTDPELESILAAGRDAGATTASWIMLRLPREVSTIWQEWLLEHAPAKATRVMNKLRDMHGGKVYQSDWGRRMRGEGAYAEMVQRRFELACARIGLKQTAPQLRTDLFRRPHIDARQMTLF